MNGIESCESSATASGACMFSFFAFSMPRPGRYLPYNAPSGGEVAATAAWARDCDVRRVLGRRPSCKLLKKLSQWKSSTF